MLKKFIREKMQENRSLKSIYNGSRAFYHRARKLSFFAYDVTHTFKHMSWTGGNQTQYSVISSELLFQFHKLEKGLCMPGEKRFFGYDPAIATIDLLQSWYEMGYSVNDPIYCGAIETLRAYRMRLSQTPPKKGEILLRRLDQQLAAHAKIKIELETPQNIITINPDDALPAYEKLVLARRSVREFSDQSIDPLLIERAISLAQLSPSACNRQPCRVHLYSAKDKIERLLSLQNGNRGFGHTAPMLLIITSDANTFFDASERNQPYVDGGLFSMNLLYALQAQGLSTCCLNWCAEPAQDKAAHRDGEIPQAERIIMYLLVGYAANTARVPRSARRALENTLITHS
ncbi:nitroreductase family protein [Chitinibacter bivalviorum]|uniref:Nitroreductase family protein n=1 Tax=Chitinibacter bivalviorum TaxID=2739434 RepID=A0A7H9BIZ8_9NEIS|nr:nitroreductase family protein [Chitinibacter bivalviorum]QLG88218.1 nitroreductase family protein [Chitinibacter bivalviorum]